MSIPDPVYLYHITHVDNLSGILQSGGLLANNRVPEDSYIDISHETIQARRHTKPVPCGPGGCLHDYAPFYLGRKSPMLFAIHKGSVAGYEQGEEPVIYLVSTIAKVVEADLGFVFTDGHATRDFTDFYDDLGQLDEVDWEVLNAKYWFANDDDPDRSRRRQAEFLVHGMAPWEIMVGIAVKTEAIKEKVEEILAASGLAQGIKVKVLPHWYY